MLTLKRSECCILRLVLKRRWFDMIESGEKRQEYRLFTDYWKRRIWNWEGRCRIKCLFYKVVEFRLGYAADSPRMAFIALWIFYRMRGRYAHPGWGEPLGEDHFVIDLGERVELED